MAHSDPYFRSPTEIVAGGAVVNVLGNSEAAVRADEIYAAAYAVREALYASYEAVNNEDPELLPLQEQTDLLLAAFCDRKTALAHYLSPEVEKALSAFRQLVPLLPIQHMDRLTRTRSGVTEADVQGLLSRWSTGQIGQAQFMSEAERLASAACVTWEPSNDPSTAGAKLVADVRSVIKQGSHLKEIARETEATVYLSAANSTVYKAVPFRGNLLQIQPILSDAPIATTNESGTFLADAHGRMPLFERAILLSRVPGVCKTELVGITAAGMAVLKQPYLGEKEPTEAQIEEWLAVQQHAEVAGQGSIARDDISKHPFVARHPVEDGAVVIGTDLNPRNSRVWNGQCIPFDPVLRKLDTDEILSHAGLRQAVDHLGLSRKRSIGGPDI